MYLWDEFGPSKAQVDSYFVRRNQIKFLKDTEGLLSEECIIWCKPLVCDFKIE